MAAKMRGMTVLVAKTCIGCDQLLAADDYGPDKRQALGRCSRCRPCESERIRDSMSRHPERTKNYQRLYLAAMHDLRRQHPEEFRKLFRARLGE